jgi:uncharacterized SAM-binding protein YcdF (DUF218 family)
LANVNSAVTPWTQRLCHGVVWLLVGGGVVIAIALVFAGRWLAATPEQPVVADLVVVLAGSHDRTLYAADLYHQGIAKRVILSRPTAEPVHNRLAALGVKFMREEDLQLDILARLNVPREQTDFLPGMARNTRDEAESLTKMLGDRPLRIIVVASPYNVRRASMILRSRLPAAISLQVVATPYEEFEWRWWRDAASARAVILELAKILYFIGGSGESA